MTLQLSRKELVLVAGAVAIGCFLRWSKPHAAAVEHFDEGIYSSTLWYGHYSDESYPSRHLYAPPLLPQAIELAHRLGGGELAPFLPGLLTGTLTLLVVWGFTRACFGMSAGIVAILLTAFSDFHIIFSRMALTDVPVLLWMTLSVWLGVSGLDRRSLKLMAGSGFMCGMAWWTKYSGWLPIAIIASGSALWWLTGARRELTLTRLLVMNLVMAAIAGLVWCPWLWTLQQFGGYAAVAANHGAYFSGLTRWRDHLTSQVIWFTELDSWLGALAIGLGLVFAGCHRWMEARCSTWHTNATENAGVQPALLFRFLSAAVVLPVVTLFIGTFGVLVSIGAGGLAGIFLWPVLSELRGGGASRQPGNDSSDGLCRTDVAAAPSVDPRLGVCVLAAWFGGLLVMTPMYAPFPRLLLPLVATLWIAAAAGIGWWIEAGVHVARRTAQGAVPTEHPGLRKAVSGLVVLALLVAIFSGLPIRRSIIHDPRTSLQGAAVETVELCRMDASATRTEPVAEAAPEYVVYAFGEPSLLYHLNALRITALPVQDVRFPAATFHRRELPTYFVFGPNALRTPDFLYTWVDADYRFEHVADVMFEPSPVVLFNLFEPQWIIQHRDDVRQQTLEIWRLIPAAG